MVTDHNYEADVEAMFAPYYGTEPIKIGTPPIETVVLAALRAAHRRGWEEREIEKATCCNLMEDALDALGVVAEPPGVEGEENTIEITHAEFRAGVAWPHVDAGRTVVVLGAHGRPRMYLFRQTRDL